MTERTAATAAGVTGIVLAAGGAARYGGPKQLARYQGVALVTRAARLALACCPAGVTVVTGAYVEEVSVELRALPVQVVHNADWTSGLASSIRRGIDAVSAEADACLLMLCDQPALEEVALRQLIAAWVAAPGAPAAARYARTVGAPAVFPRDSWPALRALVGDHGARGLLASLAQLTEVPMPAAALDVDTPTDLADLRSR